MVRTKISLLALVLALSTQSAQAAEPTRADVVINGVTYRALDTPELKPAAVAAPAFELSAREEARMKLLGETIAVKTLTFKRKIEKAARKDELEQWKKDHPKLAMVRKWSGYGVTNDRVLLPCSDWWTDHAGLGIGVAAVSSLANTGLLAGGAAR